MAEQSQSLTNLSDNLLHNFRKLTMGQRMGLLVLLALVIAAIPVLGLMGRAPDMAVLFSNLEREDLQAIVTNLDRQGIFYEVVPAGDAVKVPTERVHDLRLQMAAEGIPEVGGVGFEIFDKVGLGVTKFVQQINYRRALQGELARTISQIAEVQRTRVHLVIPERRLFSSEQKPAQAAVVLKLKRGKALTQTQVNGVVHLVASSVEGLDPSQVTVVDGHGKVLSDMAKDEGSRLTTSQLDMQQKVERDLAQHVQTMLDRVLGRNKSVVRISAPLDFRHVEVTEETFDPESQVVRSEQRSKEKVTEEISPSGVPGTRANIPDEASPEGTAKPKDAQRKSETLNYELNRKVSKIVEPTGTIKRLSVAVFVDGTYEPVVGEEASGGGENPEPKYVPRSEEEIQNLTQIVKKAVGFSEERGDQIEVVNTPFEGIPLTEGDEQGSTAIQSVLATWGGVIKSVVFLVLGLLILLFVVRPLVVRLTVPPPEPVPVPREGLPATVGKYQAELSITPEEQAIKLAAENPSSAAFVIRNWIKEEQGEKAGTG